MHKRKRTGFWPEVCFHVSVTKSSRPRPHTFKTNILTSKFVQAPHSVQHVLCTMRAMRRAAIEEVNTEHKDECLLMIGTAEGVCEATEGCQLNSGGETLCVRKESHVRFA